MLLDFGIFDRRDKSVDLDPNMVKLLVEGVGNRETLSIGVEGREIRLLPLWDLSTGVVGLDKFDPSNKESSSGDCIVAGLK